MTDYITINLRDFRQKYENYSQLAKNTWLAMNGFSHFLSENELEETNHLFGADSFELLEEMTPQDREYCMRVLEHYRKQINRWSF